MSTHFNTDTKHMRYIVGDGVKMHELTLTDSQYALLSYLVFDNFKSDSLRDLWYTYARCGSEHYSTIEALTVDVKSVLAVLSN